MPSTGAGDDDLPEWLITLIGDHGCTDWVNVNWQQAAAHEGAWFDDEKADAVVAMWPHIFKLTTLRFHNSQFRLAWWQEIIVRMLVGWIVPNQYRNHETGQMETKQVRLFRELRLWVPRKAGKSEFLAALFWLFWAIDGERGAEGYVFAADEDQAAIPFGKIAEMGKLLPADTAAEFQFLNKVIYCPRLHAGAHLLSGSPTGNHGKAPKVIFGDEMHEWKTRKVEEDLRQGSGVHLQPISLLASTTGVRNARSAGVGMHYWDETRQMLDGTINDATTLAVIFAADPDDDWQDEDVWARVNPNLHLTISIDYLRREAAKAKNNKRAEAHFRCYHLNQWVDDTAQWLDPRIWDENAPDKTAWKTRAQTMAGRVAWGGLDLSRSRDFAALVWLFPPIESGAAWQTHCHFWLPEAALAQREPFTRELIEGFRDQGAVTIIPGEVIDQDWILAAILEGCETFEVEQIALDRMFANKLQTDLQKGGVDADQLCVVPQGMMSMADPSAEFERMVYAREFDLGGQPVLRWMARHCAVRFDVNMNFMPAKKGKENIDGIAAAVMARAASMAEHEEPNVPFIVVL